MAFDQTHRHGRFTLDRGEEVLLLTTFEATERLGEPYVLYVGVLSEDKEIDFMDHLGKPGLVEIYDSQDNLQRCFHGLLAEATLTESDNTGFSYLLTFRPWLWFLSLNLNYKMYQNQSVTAILADIFNTAGFIKFDTAGLRDLQTREYCVQFHESDFDFVSRLMEEEGIYYYFEHGADEHVLKLCDQPSAHKDIEGTPELEFLPGADASLTVAHVHEWSERTVATPRAAALRDFNFKEPGADLSAKASADSEFDSDKAEVYDYPGGFEQDYEGRTLAELRSEAARAEQRLFTGAAQAPRLACGRLFTLSSHETERYNGQHLIVSQRYSISPQLYRGGQDTVAPDDRVVMVDFEAVPASVRWRKPQTTRKPVARGPQTAIVTGPSGEEVHCDEYGRVKVHFHWDRLQPKDDKSSCWVRVSQGWAGKGFGIMNLPRVGQEVIVDFLDGNPDRPIITGRVYNEDQPVPYYLPDEMTKSTWKSQSVNADGFNEIRYEDKGGDEEIYVHAQKDMKVEVLNDRTATIKQNDTLTVEQGNMKVDVSAGEITMEAAQSITLKVGSNTIKIDQEGVTLDGIKIKFTASATIQGSAPMIESKADGMSVLKGGTVMIN